MIFDPWVFDTKKRGVLIPPRLRVLSIYSDNNQLSRRYIDCFIPFSRYFRPAWIRIFRGREKMRSNTGGESHFHLFAVLWLSLPIIGQRNKTPVVKRRKRVPAWIFTGYHIGRALVHKKNKEKSQKNSLDKMRRICSYPYCAKSISLNAIAFFTAISIGPRLSRICKKDRPLPR